MEELPSCPAELGLQGLVAKFGRDCLTVLSCGSEVRDVDEGVRAMKGFLERHVVFTAHVTGVEDEPEEEDDDGDEVEARRRTSWHLGGRV